MIRTHQVLLVSLGLAVGCATSSSNSASQNPDAGNVQYDMASQDGADSGATADGGQSGATTSGRKPRTSTGTRTLGSREGVKKLAAKKPPRTDGGGGTGGSGKVAKKKSGPRFGGNPKGGGGKTDTGGTGPVNGLMGNVFSLPAGTEALPDFASLGTPTATVPLRALDIQTKGTFPGVAVDAPMIGIQFLGSINFVEDGVYTLCLNSSAGSRLFFDEFEIVNNDGLHGAKEECGTVELGAGEYGVVLDYFYAKGDEVVLNFTWAREGGEPATVPHEVLFMPEAT